MRKASRHRCTLRKRLAKIYAEALDSNFEEYLASGARLGSLYYLTLLQNNMKGLGILKGKHTDSIAEILSQTIEQQGFQRNITNFSMPDVTNTLIDTAGLFKKANILDPYYEYITAYRSLLVGDSKVSMSVFFDKNMNNNEESEEKKPEPSGKVIIGRLLELWGVKPGRNVAVSYKAFNNIITVKNQRSGREVDIYPIDTAESKLLSRLKGFITEGGYTNVTSVAREPGSALLRNNKPAALSGFTDLLAAMKSAKDVGAAAGDSSISFNKASAASFLREARRDEKVQLNDGNSTVLYNGRLDYFMSLCSHLSTAGGDFDLHYVNAFTYDNYVKLLAGYDTARLGDIYTSFSHFADLKLVNLFCGSSCEYIRHHTCRDKPLYSLKNDLYTSRLFEDCFFNFYLAAAEEVKKLSGFGSKTSGKSLLLVNIDELPYYIKALVTRGSVFLDDSSSPTADTKKAAARLYGIENDPSPAPSDPIHEEISSSMRRLHGSGLVEGYQGKKDMDNCDLLKYMKLKDL